MAVACTTGPPVMPPRPAFLNDDSPRRGFGADTSSRIVKYTHYDLPKRPNYGEVRGWSATLPGRNVPFDFVYKFDDVQFDNINRQPGLQVDRATTNPEGLFSWERGVTGYDNPHRALMQEGMRQVPLVNPRASFQEPMDLCNRHIERKYKTMSEIDGSRVCYVDGIRRMRDEYKMTEKMYQMPRQYGFLQPNYRSPNDYHHLGGLEAGQKWAREVKEKDGAFNKWHSGTIPRNYQGHSDANWKYTTVSTAAMPGYSRFESVFPNIDCSSARLAPSKYKGFYNMTK